MAPHHDRDDAGGLALDRQHLVGRRHALRWVAAVGVGSVLVGCSSDSGSTPAASTASTAATGQTGTDGAGAASPSSTVAPADGSGAGPASSAAQPETVAPSPGPEIPDEGAGPFPADGTNGPNLLEIDGVVRPDLRTSIGEFSGTAEGIPAAVALTVVDAETGDPLPGAAVYIWQCTADGRYSVYEIEDQNYLRGMQAADDAGRLGFTTVFPGCYPGRWPHFHIEVYPSLAEAGSGNQAIKTSQIALPRADCEVVYQDPRYGDSSASLAELTLATDGVFADGWDDQLATVMIDDDGAYTLSLLVRV